MLGMIESKVVERIASSTLPKSWTTQASHHIDIKDLHLQWSFVTATFEAPLRLVLPGP
jgi:hypothetical protein